MLVLALVKCIEIIGEAAANLSPETKALHPGIPWRTIIAMRNHLIHAYFNIDLDRVWGTVVADVPVLIDQVEPLVPSEDR